MTGRLDGKTALITGAGRGLGRAMAILFAAEGAKVAVLSRSRTTINPTVEEIRAAGGTAIGVECDVFDLERIDTAVEETVEALGPIDVLVNNAFEQSSFAAPIMEISLDQLNRQFVAGPISYLRFMQKCFPYMDGRDGRIINLASCVGVLSHQGYGPYAMGKEAVRALTRTAAREWGARKVTVNSLLPIAATPAQDRDEEARGGGLPVPPIPRIGDAIKDVAPVALFLASAEASYVTGYSFFADGGYSIDAAR